MVIHAGYFGSTEQSNFINFLVSQHKMLGGWDQILEQLTWYGDTKGSFGSAERANFVKFFLSQFILSFKLLTILSLNMNPISLVLLRCLLSFPLLLLLLQVIVIIIVFIVIMVIIIVIAIITIIIISLYHYYYY